MTHTKENIREYNGLSSRLNTISGDTSTKFFVLTPTLREYRKIIKNTTIKLSFFHDICLHVAEVLQTEKTLWYRTICKFQKLQKMTIQIFLLLHFEGRLLTFKKFFCEINDLHCQNFGQRIVIPSYFSANLEFGRKPSKFPVKCEWNSYISEKTYKIGLFEKEKNLFWKKLNFFLKSGNGGKFAA